MKLFLQKYKLVLLRTVGAFFLVLGFVIHFWLSPKQGYTEVEIAAANVARMEASMAPSQNQHAKKNTGALFAEEYKQTREEQVRYLTIFAMLLGIGFLIYSFVKKEEPEL
ncbi:MAG: hypothetical protein RBR59_00670 [Sulfurimonadaceae bacterium]|jgi:uncharacterized protein YjeT (DUF2065 family)|nr:hypothetical protein [Sulfurimonadaceae bacterium]